MPSRDDKMYFYDTFADRFEKVVDMYDTNRRIDVIFDDFLSGLDLNGKRLLDAGSGMGWFSQRAVERGARVTSLDVGTHILSKVAEKCRTDRVVGDICRINIKEGSFDVVLSSEVIEHTPNPREAVRNLCRVLKRDGILVLTVPNRIWHFSVLLANAMKIRPYEGYENWVGWRDLRQWLQEEGMEVEAYRGIHLFPFVIKATHPVLCYLDRFGKAFGPVMVNIAVKARKRF